MGASAGHAENSPGDRDTERRTRTQGQRREGETEAMKRRKLWNTVQTMEVTSAYVLGAGALESRSMQGRTGEPEGVAWEVVAHGTGGRKCHSPLLAELESYTAHFHLIT